MNPKLSRIVYTTITCLIVFILLLSNLGNNFKSDVFSYKYIIDSTNSIKSNWLSSFTQKEFSDLTSKYLTSMLKEYSIEPLEINNIKTYTQNFSVNIPFEETKSYIQVISKYNNTIKEYTHGEDFIEDISGLFSAKSVNGYSDTLNDDTLNNQVPDILLAENYKSQAGYDIKNYDEKLKALGVSAVIYPETQELISSETIPYDSDYTPTSKGILKLAVSDNTYNEIIDFMKKGYKLKLKSGVKIKEQTLTNVYGKVQGSNKNYKPLIVSSFYDGKIPSKFQDNKGDAFQTSSYTPSMLLECARMITMQDNISPDRTIIFAFLSGKPIEKKGIEEFKNLNIDGDFILLDNLGNSNKFNLSIHEDYKSFSSGLNYFMDKNNLKIVSSTTDGYMYEKSAYLTGLNNLGTNLDFNNSYNTCKFVLSFIADECYNLDFITANLREIRGIKRILRDYTVPISLLTLIFITYIVFKYPEIKNSN